MHNVLILPSGYKRLVGHDVDCHGRVRCPYSQRIRNRSLNYLSFSLDHCLVLEIFSGHILL
jgi:hypothetical protein